MLTAKASDPDTSLAEHPGGAGAERLNFFSDAVVAIAITLLALELHPPDGTSNAALLHDLSTHSTDYIAFLISFAVIGTHWLGHHRMFTDLTRLGGRLIRWNMLWLLTIILTPFTTRVIVGDGAFAARFTIYAVNQALAAVFFLLAVHSVDRHGLAREGAPRERFTRTYYRVAVMAAAFLVSIPLAFVTHWAYVCWVAIPLVWRARAVWLRLRRSPAG